MGSKDTEHALIYQTKDMKWTVYANVLPNKPDPLKYATIVELGICLFADAVIVAKKHGYADKDIIVQFIKNSEPVS